MNLTDAQTNEIIENAPVGKTWAEAFWVDPRSGKVLGDPWFWPMFSSLIQYQDRNQSLNTLSNDVREKEKERQERFADQPYRIVLTDILKEYSTLLGVPTQCEWIAKLAELDENGQLVLPDMTYLRSFYLDDLLGILQRISIKNVGISLPLKTYLSGSSMLNNRKDILSDMKTLGSLLRTEDLPIARWPANPQHSLYMAQQVAVSEILKMSKHNADRSLIAVNGPPGTGKTTLLRDVIANIVVERAIRISKLNKSSDAISAVSRAIQIKDQHRTYHPVSASLIEGTQIYVTSNNNAAVENISKALPEWDSIYHEVYAEASYFGMVAEHVEHGVKGLSKHIPNTVSDQNFKPYSLIAKRKRWGLISLPLGKSANRKQVAKLFNDFRPNSDPLPSDPMATVALNTWLRQHQGTEEDWIMVKKIFVDQLTVVKNLIEYRHQLEYKISLLSEIPLKMEHIETQIIELEMQRNTIFKDLDEQINNLHKQLEMINSDELLREGSVNNARLQLDLLVAEHRNLVSKKPEGLLNRLLYTFNIHTTPMKVYNEIVNSSQMKINNKKTDLSALESNLSAIQKLKNQLSVKLLDINRKREKRTSRIIKQILALRNDHTKLNEELEKIKSELGNVDIQIPDKAFWGYGHEKKQLASLWVDHHLDYERGLLFLYALKLHEATVTAQWKAWAANARLLREWLMGNVRDVALQQNFWNLLFFLVPVVSGSLASVRSQFGDIDNISIGWVLIDESGQATPQSVPGILQRAKRAVLVGDPLQIEPVFTIPEPLVRKLADVYDVSNEWIPPSASAQTIADQTMSIGGSISNGDRSVWTGLPLRVHRRCGDPMFSIANEIAYENQMVQSDNNKKLSNFPYGSGWIDVMGTVFDKQLVQEEMDVLRQLLNSILNQWPTLPRSNSTNENYAKVYIISPFKKIAKSAKNIIINLPDFAKQYIDAGTVHTFQGKEAEIVIFVLGTAKGDKGAFARAWASKTPNILNVAVTRAKDHIIVIGNREEWMKQKYFDVLSNLPDIKL